MTKSWNHKEETLNGQPRKGGSRNACIQDPLLTQTHENLRRPYVLWAPHSIAFICRVITLMDHENTSQSKQKYRPGVGQLGSKPWPWRLSGRRGRRRGRPGAVRAPFLLANHPWVRYHFQPQHVRADPSILGPHTQVCDLTHPEILTLSLQGPIPSLLPQKPLMPHL